MCENEKRVDPKMDDERRIYDVPSACVEPRWRPTSSDAATSLRYPAGHCVCGAHMAPESSLRRCRIWYARLLHLYATPFHDRFAETTEQAFAESRQQRRTAGVSPLRFVIWAFPETFAASSENTSLVEGGLP